MSEKSFLPKTETALGKWLNNFLKTFKGSASLLGYSKKQIQTMENDVNAINHAIRIDAISKARQKDIAEYKNNLFHGTSYGKVEQPPDAEILPPLSIAVEPGSLARILEEIKIIKINENYSTEMGKEMGIISSDLEIKYKDVQTELKLESSTFNGIKMKFFLKGMTGADIYGIRIGLDTQLSIEQLNKLKWVHLASVASNFYVDTRMNISKHAELRIYKAILKKKGLLVGKPSNIVAAIAEIYIDAKALA